MRSSVVMRTVYLGQPHSDSEEGCIPKIEVKKPQDVSFQLLCIVFKVIRIFSEISQLMGCWYA